MRVLLVEFDLFGSVGGGQTFYRSVVSRHPEIEFYYFRIRETEQTARPSNAHAIPYLDNPALEERPNEDGDLEPPSWAAELYRQAVIVARSVAHRTFDVVDTPDYRHAGIFLAPAFRHYHVRYGRLALSMHGRLSNSIRTNWGTEGRLDPRIVWLEESQYAVVDTRYFISEQYREEWGRISDLEAHCIDPMWFFRFPRSTYLPVADEAPSINFIGRTEKCKGPHLFVNMVWWLSRDSYSTARIIGPDSHDPAGVPSTSYLRTIAARRVKDLQFLPSMSPEELARLFGSRAVTLIPSQLDTFNLVALESLLSGCPTVVGSRAGICRYLRSRFPEIPFEDVDVNNYYASVSRIESLLADYDQRRQDLAEALGRQDFSPRGASLAQVYTSSPAWDRDGRGLMETWYRRFQARIGSVKRAA